MVSRSTLYAQYISIVRALHPWFSACHAHSVTKWGIVQQRSCKLLKCSIHCYFSKLIKEKRGEPKRQTDSYVVIVIDYMSCWQNTFKITTGLVLNQHSFSANSIFIIFPYLKKKKKNVTQYFTIFWLSKQPLSSIRIVIYMHCWSAVYVWFRGCM